MNVVHLTDSPFFGGPERQMLGLALSLPPAIRTTILCFRDGATAQPFVDRLRANGVAARMIAHANPHFLRMIGDVAHELRSEQAHVLICHGYKADVIGWIAARRVGISVISVSRGWTAHTRKVRINEAVDRRFLRHMDAVVCVSEGQAAKVRRARVRGERVHVIHNSIDTSRFAVVDSQARETLQSFFPSPRDHIVVGVGRLSPEKGFDKLVEAAAMVAREQPSTGFVLLGDGPHRQALEEQVRAASLGSVVAFAGFRPDVDRLLPAADVLVQSSYTEGLPNVVLEACAAGIAVVATDVGGTREVVRHGVNGHLVPAGDAPALAARLIELLRSPELRREMGERGRDVVRTQFSFHRQSAAYVELFDSLRGRSVLTEAVAAA